MADRPWRREEAVKQAVIDCLYTIADTELYAALYEIIFDPSTKIDWRKAEGILQEHLPDLELFGKPFDSSTITMQQLSDFLDDTGDSEDGDFLNYHYTSDPNSFVTYRDAYALVLEYFNDRYTDPESINTNAACATNSVRAAFKKYAFY